MMTADDLLVHVVREADRIISRIVIHAVTGFTHPAAVYLLLVCAIPAELAPRPSDER